MKCLLTTRTLLFLKKINKHTQCVYSDNYGIYKRMLFLQLNTFSLNDDAFQPKSLLKNDRSLRKLRTWWNMIISFKLCYSLANIVFDNLKTVLNIEISFGINKPKPFRITTYNFQQIKSLRYMLCPSTSTKHDSLQNILHSK